jgi:hypothetical protein
LLLEFRINPVVVWEFAVVVVVVVVGYTGGLGEEGVGRTTDWFGCGCCRLDESPPPDLDRLNL